MATTILDGDNDDDDNNNNKDDNEGSSENNNNNVEEEEDTSSNHQPSYDATTPIDDLLQQWEDARSEQDYETSDAIRTFLKDTHGIRAATYEQDKEKQFIKKSYADNFTK